MVQDEVDVSDLHPGVPMVKKLIIVLAIAAIGGLVAKKVTSS